jgi:hypothetical protein
MDESALRTLIASLYAQIEPLHFWLHVWTVVVIVGCAGELLFVIYEYRDDRGIWYKARSRGFIAFPEKPPTIVLILELLSVAAVVIGIAGELNIDFKAGRLETKLRDANSQLISLLGRKAEDAKLSAEAASSASVTAKKSAEAAGGAASIAQEEASGAEASAVEVSQLEAQLRTDVAESDVILAAMESRHTFRPFLFRELRGMSANITVECAGSTGPPEWMFAQKLHSALQELGFKDARVLRGQTTHTSYPTGITIFNKWVTLDSKGLDKVNIGQSGEREADPIYIMVYLAGQGVPQSDRGVMERLSLALAAKLQKDPNLKDGQYRILIGSPQEK